MATASDTTQITQLVLRERQSRVRNRAEELRECFHPDATVTTSWVRGSARDYLTGAQARSAVSGPIVNRVGPPVVHQAGLRAVAELPSSTTRWIPVKGVEAVLVSFMRLIYRIEQRDGHWKISDLAAVNEGDTIEAAVPGADLAVTPEDVAGFRHSYRFLAYSRSLDGDLLNPDLYGTDRPEAVDALYDDTFAWMNGQPDEAGVHQ
jgi:hypothetical protein